MLQVSCNNCSKPLSKVKWCWSCKKVAYCDRKCQKKNWKQHKRKCTYNYIKANNKRYKQKYDPNENPQISSEVARYTAKDQPFNSIPTSLFSRNKFTQYLTQCNPALIPDFGDIIYTTLTGYQTIFNLTDIFPSHILNTIPMKKIEMHFDSGACPTDPLTNRTFAGDYYPLLEALEFETKGNCKECSECLLELLPIVEEITECAMNVPINEKLLEEKVLKYCFLRIPKHIKPNWKRYTYGVQFVRDISDDSVSVLLQILTKDYENMDPDQFIREYQYSLASFRANDVMPYFDGDHYAYLLKAVLDQYQFGTEEYSRIDYIGFSWSITSNVCLKSKFLKTVHSLFNTKIPPTNDFFFCHF